MKNKLILLPLIVMGLGLHALAQASKAHVHGNAAMQVVVDGNTVEIALQSPLDSLVGFEHAPRNERQRNTLLAMEERFRSPVSLFVPTEAARCHAEPAELVMPFTGKVAKSHHRDEHAELEATVRFQCKNPSALKEVEVKLFDVFPKLHRVDVQVVSGRGQAAVRLTPKQRHLQW